MEKKPVILVCTDSPVVSTGFGRVCYNLVKRWADTDKYTIVCMGTNDRGKAHPFRNYKNVIIEPLPYIGEDPYGREAMPELLQKYQPDLVFGLNDLWVWTADERMPHMQDWFFKHLKGYKPYIPFIGYFPVDGRPWEQKWVKALNNMAFAATFTDYGYKVLSETPNVNMSKVNKVYHGHSHEDFYPITKEEANKMRKHMGVPEDAYVVGCINRNQERKNLPSLITAFKMFNDGYSVCDGCGHYQSLDFAKDCEYCGSYDFTEGKKGVPQAHLYLHMNPYDGRGYRLPKLVQDNKAKNVIMMQPYDVAEGISTEDLNKVYNLCDVTVNVALAGGYELGVAESMAAGTPVIATRTTSITEQLQDDRGYLVPPAMAVAVNDASHCIKHFVDIDRLVDTLYHVYENPEEAAKRADNAMPFAHSRNWDDSAKQFEALFDRALAERVVVHKYLDKDAMNLLFVNDSSNFAEILSMVPALNEFVLRNPQANVVLGVPKRVHNILDNLSDTITVIDSGRMWFEDSEIVKYKIQVHNMSGAAAQFIQASNLLGQQLSMLEGYHKSFGLNIDDETFKPNNLLIPFTDEELNISKVNIEHDPDKFNIVLIANRDANTIMPDNWQELINKLNTTKDINLSVVGNTESLNALKDVRTIHGLSIRENLAILSVADCVVTSSQEYILGCNFVDSLYVCIPSKGENIEHLIKHSKVNHDGTVLAKKSIIKNATPHEQNRNVLVVPHGEVFARILGAKSWWISNKNRS